MSYDASLRQRIAHDYMSGLSQRLIAKKYNVGCGSVCLWLKEMDIKARPTNTSKLNTDTMLAIATAYKVGCPITDLARIYNVGTTTVYSYLDKTNTQRRTLEISSRKTPININIFNDLNLEIDVYWLGFLMADGHVQRKRHRIEIRLTGTDFKHLEKFSDFVGSGSVKVKKATGYGNVAGKTMCHIRLESKTVWNRLVRLGWFRFIDSGDAGKIFKAIPKDKVKHFLRGFGDGDGTFGVYKSRTSKRIHRIYEFLHTYRKTALQMQKLLAKCGFNSSVVRRSVIWSTRITGYKALGFLDWLYTDSKISLDRKREKWRSYQI